VLVVSEVALALVLLVGATLLIRTFVGLGSVKPGFDPHNVLTLQTPLRGGNYNTTAKVDSFVVNVCRRIESLPGVEAAASSVVLPVTVPIDLPFNIVGKPPGKGSDYNGDEQWRSVSEHYFQVFRIPLLRGRAFRQTDTSGAPKVVVINEAMARRYWPKEDPIGQIMVIGKGIGPQFADTPREIVGIAGSVRERGLDTADVGVMYIPQSQVPEGLTALANQVVPLSWEVRTAGSPLQMRSLVEKQFRSADLTVTPTQERTMEQVIEKSVARQHFNMLLLGIFAAVALLLAAIGIYGLMAYGVEQQRQEIGIRMALGAGTGQVLRMVVAQGMKLACAGVAVGLGLAWAMTRYLGSLLFGVGATDPLTFGAVALLLTVVALVATLIPARRAAQTAPDQALRYQ
jgi:predicted permease